MTGDKDACRKAVWLALDQAGAASDPYNRIPAFVGREAAAERLAGLPVWQEAQVIKVVPDRAQEPVRRLALEAGKTLYMAVPKLAEAEPFYRLQLGDLAISGASAAEAAQNRRAVELGQSVEVDEMQPVDLVVLGSVAVNRQGVRLGKGAGYSDIELALLSEGGLLQEHSTIVTTVHPLQLLDAQLPESEHDYRVDLIVTPDQVIECPAFRRPTGLVWEHLEPSMIQAIPPLRARRSRMEGDR